MYSNILITGGCGFVGSNFVPIMCKRYPKTFFVNIDNMSKREHVNFCHYKGSNYKFIKGDITNYQLLCDLLSTYNIDLIVHMAAQSNVDYSFTKPMNTLQDNIVGTLNILEAVKVANPKIRIINMSTDEVYGDNNSEIPHQESDNLNPTNPYAATKAAAEMLINSYKIAFGLSVNIIRSNNIYGPQQTNDKVIPSFISKILNGDKPVIHGTGQVQRKFVHVMDVVEALDLVIRKGVKNETYNISCYRDNYISIYNLAAKVYNYIHGNVDGFLVSHIEDRPYNDIRYNINSEKLQSLGWRQLRTFDDGLHALITEISGHD